MKWLIALFVSVLFALPALGDVVTTQDGRQIKGKITDDSDGRISVQTKTGEVQVSRGQVKKIEDRTSLMKMFGLQRKLIPDTDADRFFDLSRWCGDKGLFDEEGEVLQWVIAIDFDHEQARKALGYIRDRSGAWVKMQRESGEKSGDFKKALKYFKSGKDEKAEEILGKIIKATPGFLEAYYLLAEIYITDNRFGQAAEVYKEMLKIDPKSPLTYYGHAYLQFLEKKYQNAMATLKTALARANVIKEALARKTMLSEIYFLMGRTQVEMGVTFYNEAEANLLKAVALNRKHFRAWGDLGNLYGIKGIHKKAADAFNKSLASNSRYKKARYNWAVMLYREGEIQKAMQKVFPLCSTSRLYLPALLLYGRCYQRCGKSTTARKWYQKYIAKGGDDPRVHEWVKEVG